MSERIPTDVLVEQARAIGDRWRPPNDPLTHALADRLAELAALEPVRMLLPAVARLVVYQRPDGKWTATSHLCDRDPRLWGIAVEADTPEAALAALAEAVRG